MSDLNITERLKLENLFEMEGGYVLDFSNNSLAVFISEISNLEFYSDKYLDRGNSKANRLRIIWLKESNLTVGNLTLRMLEYWKAKKEQPTESENILFKECRKIVNRLTQDTVIVEEINAIREDQNDRNFNLLAKSIKKSIKENEPEVALDRLHTYTMKFIRQLCDKYNISFTENESLNAVFGKYIKNQENMIESEMSKRILKYSINLLEAFNDIRNNKSLAHDNSILNYDESVLILNNITNLIKFIETIEGKDMNETVAKV